MSKIRILVADDMESIREYYSTLIDSSDQCECVGTAGDEKDVIQKAKQLNPDIILLDIQMDRMNSGIRVIPEIIRCSPKIKIIMFTVSEDNSLVFEAIRLGAKDYVIKNSTFKELMHTIIKVYNNDDYMRSDIAHKLLDEIKIIENKQNSLLFLFSRFSSLTPAEIDILRSMCEGVSISEIADIRFVEHSTIRSSISRIMKKLEYKNSKNLVKHIKDMKLFSLLDNLSPHNEN